MQHHQPGVLGISDFTLFKGAPITVAGKVLEHRLFHFRLPYSGWCHVEVIHGWPLVLPWIMADPMLTGQQAMQRLEREQPGLYGGSLRTLQRRMAEWRVAHAEQVVGQQMGAIREQENSQLNNKRENNRRGAN